jgi:hypothetical protein
MRSYFCYVRTTDNQFFSCSIAVDNIDSAPLAAFRRFREMGNPLPANPAMIVSMRFVADDRNLMEGMPVSEVAHGDPDSYAVYSEYVRGETVTH